MLDATWVRMWLLRWLHQRKVQHYCHSYKSQWRFCFVRNFVWKRQFTQESFKIYRRLEISSKFITFEEIICVWVRLHWSWGFLRIWYWNLSSGARIDEINFIEIEITLYTDRLIQDGNLAGSSKFFLSFRGRRGHNLNIFRFFESLPMAPYALHLQHLWSGIFFCPTDHEFFVDFTSWQGPQLISTTGYRTVMKL